MGYRDFVKMAVSGEIKSPFEHLKAGFILGGEGFREKVRRLLINVEEDEELPVLKHVRKFVSPDSVVDKVATILGIERGELIRRGKFRLYPIRLLGGLHSHSA